MATAIEQLKYKIRVVSSDFTEWMQAGNDGLSWMDRYDGEQRKRAERYKDVPLVVAPGQEEAYLQDRMKKNEAATVTPEQVQPETEQRERVEKEVREPVAFAEKETRGEQTAQNNANGWGGLLGALGLEGMGDIAGNLGYVMAMLPDILLGAFTGKTQSLRIKDNLLPIASIVAGMFVRNPMLKMLLIGLGGGNLLNKAGHEAMGGEQAEVNKSTAVGGSQQNRRYPDEPLNPRIVNPVLQGGMLIATVDRVPCTIQLSPAVADAYRAGALPLNTLANAVLAKSDQLRQAASQNYDNGQQETIVRTRGIQ